MKCPIHKLSFKIHQKMSNNRTTAFMLPDISRSHSVYGKILKQIFVREVKKLFMCHHCFYLNSSNSLVDAYIIVCACL